MNGAAAEEEAKSPPLPPGDASEPAPGSGTEGTGPGGDADEGVGRKPSASDNAEKKFVNKGLHRWEEIRSEWRTRPPAATSNNNPGGSGSSGQSTSSQSTRTRRRKKRHANDIDIDEIIDLIVSNRWRQQAPPRGASSSASSLDTARNATRRRDDACFKNPVSLPQMVDVLVDLWEAEGLDI
ncbi:hypothetical protein THAOC_16768 [Thalassiosira oceanica]|uniref:DUF4050 domain-containing protein n=1 Tax=Thalassiosira oceanica TaxID=159749 RepID=K0SWI7_THAOC|nr:hypothetical protein THAOC_16768 [Thalassiosira oceanica]|eukprot:EJK62612.1 hypothetical protein THAOC_16768 [Thalassiosira oceanica]